MAPASKQPCPHGGKRFTRLASHAVYCKANPDRQPPKPQRATVVKFCSCCGTNLEAVAMALDLARKGLR